MLKNLVDEPSFRGKRRVFKDRLHAGNLLAERLAKYRGGRAVVLAIPAGGIPAGRVVADRLALPFDIILVRKVQIPWEPEAGFGAVSWLSDVILNEELVQELGLSEDAVAACVNATKEEIRRRLKKFREDLPSPSLEERTAILVDDGLASGYTMLAAISSVRKLRASKAVVAVPTASARALSLVSPHADEILCLNIRDEAFYAVADAYRNWYDLEDDEVLRYVRQRGEIEQEHKRKAH